MTDIVEFLTARLDAEEAVAQDLLSQEYPLEYRHQGMHANIWSNPDYSEEGISFSPERVLADVASKRRIIALADEVTGMDLQIDGEWGVGTRDERVDPYLGDVLLRLLAQPYADHPDFDPSWGQQ